jgi:uncharacterized membrane protein
MTLLRSDATTPADPSADGAAGAETGTERIVDRSGTRLAERGAWSLVWFGVLAGSVSLWHFWWSGEAAAALAPLLALAALAGLAACWMVANPRHPVFQWCSLAAAGAAAVLPQVVVIATRTSYITDSTAFGELTTRALLRGVDPYRASMAGAAHLVNVPNRYWTYTIDGGHVTHASYPAGSFLFDVPAMALGLGHHAVDATDLFAWVVTGVLVFALLPASLRWLGALVLATPVLVTMGTDATFLPFLVLAAWRWDRFGTGADGGVAAWLGPVALGMACAVKQLPWFCVPFLAVGIGIEARRTSRRVAPVVARYLGVVAAVFAVVNLPFALWDPAAWARGSLLPLVQPLVADGQGLVTLATHGITGGVDLTWLAVAGALAYLTTLLAFAGWYSRLKRLWPVLVPVVFFFGVRSLSSYLLDFLPVILVAAASVNAAPPAPARQGPARRARTVRALVAAGVLGTVGCGALAFASPPLSLAVRGVTTTTAGRVLVTVRVWVRNDTASTVVPHVMVNTGNNPDGFLTPAHGRSLVLGPHQAETVTLVAPNQTVAPQHGARWLVEAYTTAPAALSTSSLTTWHAWHG